ncbi:unnamed protein product [Alternaria alternata]
MATDVALDTTIGTIVVELYHDHAPKTCKNFSTLAQRNYFNGLIFHRIIPNFMIQGGDPTGTGRGGESIYGEKHSQHGQFRANTNGSQFFITLAPTPWLDGKHTIFGRVKSGMQIVKKLGLVKTDKEDRPVEEVKIIKAYLVDDGAFAMQRY